GVDRQIGGDAHHPPLTPRMIPDLPPVGESAGHGLGGDILRGGGVTEDPHGHTERSTEEAVEGLFESGRRLQFGCHVNEYGTSRARVDSKSWPLASGTPGITRRDRLSTERARR